MCIDKQWNCLQCLWLTMTQWLFSSFCTVWPARQQTLTWLCCCYCKSCLKVSPQVLGVSFLVLVWLLSVSLYLKYLLFYLSGRGSGWHDTAIDHTIDLTLDPCIRQVFILFFMFYHSVSPCLCLHACGGAMCTFQLICSIPVCCCRVVTYSSYIWMGLAFLLLICSK